MDNEKLIQYIRDDLKEVKKDVKQLLEFKWQIIGWAVGISGFLSLLISFAGLFFGKK